MPTIQKLPKKEKPPRNNTDIRKLRQKAYNDVRWRRLRMWYYSLHPLCEVCLSKGKVVPGVDVHHKQSFIVDGEIKWEKFLDGNNLQTVCKECHAEIHNEEQGNTTAKKMIEILDSLFADEDK